MAGLISLLMVASAFMLAPAANAAARKPGFPPGQTFGGSDTLDQQQTEATSTETIGGPSSPSPISEAQTFTAGLSGRLDRVQLYLSGNASDTGGLTVEITTASGGGPTPTVLESTTVAAAAIPPGGGWVQADFGWGVPVSSGGQYAIVAYAGGSDVYGWGFSSTNPYAGGEADYSTASPPSSWAANSSVDTAFMTYVAVPCTASLANQNAATANLSLRGGCAAGRGGGRSPY